MYKEHMKSYKVFKVVPVRGRARMEKSEKNTESAVQSSQGKTGLQPLQKQHDFLVPVSQATQKQQN